MGLFQQAVETYDAHRELVGQERAGHEILAPVSHITAQPDLEITLEEDGSFASARLWGKKEGKLPIPVTEASAGRTSGSCPHPLCDQLCYLAPYDEQKHTLYLTQLTEWAESADTHPMLTPILAYVRGGTILDDLVGSGLIKLDRKGRPAKEHLLVCWRVHGIGSPRDGCWQQPSLFQAFHNWYVSRCQGEELCMVTGELGIPASQHLKGILPIKGNAKLISANDTQGFTYLGRFTDERQAATVSYLASQKAHNALRWLVAEQGAQVVSGRRILDEEGQVLFGGRVFLCWNPKGNPICHAAGRFGSRAEATTTPSDYREALRQTLAGYRSRLPEENSAVVIAAFEAATAGRLSVTYYSELMASDYLQRLHDWDAHCFWYHWQGQIWAPTLRQIVDCAWGTRRGAKLETEKHLLRQQIQRLVACRIDQAPMPRDFVVCLVHWASNPLAWVPKQRREILFTACAVIQKYRYDVYKEECTMALEPELHDRSYQFGRLLAVLEQAERSTYNKNEDREPNAVRMQNVFSRRPLYASKLVIEQLQSAYLPRLKPGARVYYKRLIDQIMEQISRWPAEEWNAPLTERYLIGYSLQRNELCRPTKNTAKTEETAPDRAAKEDN